MGLFSWIKNRYYDFRLGQADKYVENHNLDKARLVYESLLGKQPFACVHLAKMLIDNATKVSARLSTLKRLLELQQYSNEDSKSEYDSTLNSYISDIESLASSSFSSSHFRDAVDLLSAIKELRKDQSFSDKLNRYKAYKAFNDSNANSLSHLDYKDVVYYLQHISNPSVNDIRCFIKTLEQQKRFQRGINLLLPFLNIGNWVKDTIFKYIVEIISNNDSERKDVKRISEFCTDKNICKESSVDLAKRACQKAANKDYASAVLFDSFAAEYLSDNNSFNFDRCNHIVEDISTRANAKEIKSLIELAKSLKLTEAQILKLNNRINEIAVASVPATAITICRLFIGVSTFDKVYIEKALALAKSGQELNLNELRKVVKNTTTKSSLPDVLGPFLIYVPALETEFVEAAINVIIAEKSVDLLDKYWKVKNDSRFIEAVVNKSFSDFRKFTNHIAQSHNAFLDDPKCLESFCDGLRDTGDLDLILKISEGLLKAKKNALDFYITIVLKYSKSFAKVEDSLDLINRGLNHAKNDKLERLLLEKKRLITRLISEKKFDRAEAEITSILNKDNEAPTLLAELYFNRAKSSDKTTKIAFYEKVLSVNEKYSLHDRFLNYLQETLGSLAELAKEVCTNGNADESLRIAARIKNYWAHWIPLYVWLRNVSRPEDGSLSFNIKYDAATLQEIVDTCPSSKDYPSEEVSGLWSRYYENKIKKSENQPKDKAIESLSKLRRIIAKYAPERFSNSKHDEISRLVVKLKWELAIEEEHEHLFDEATTLYDEIAGDVVTSYVNRAELRSLICHVKSEALDARIEERINQALQLRSYQALREDLAYRYACYLLKQTRPSDAENILRAYLPDENELLDMCENIYVKEAELKLAELNQLVKCLNDGKMSVAEATEFKIAVREYKKQITDKLKDLGRQFSQFAPKIESYILNKMFEEEIYLDLLNKLMLENPNYVENNTDFRNIAIASLGIIESDNNDESIVKRAIATCLTAIFSDRLFVESLDYTSWDDKYTFTLDGSLGQTNYDDYDELPENVNFDYAVENENIAIRDVQNSLLSRVEASVRKNHPSLERFCNDEKDALSKLIELNLDKSYILASPFLCRSLAAVRMSIENAFEYELTQDYGNREDVIALGSTYGFTTQEYDWYSQAKNMLHTCKSVLSPNPITSVDRAFDKSRIKHIKKYSRLASELKSIVSTAINNDIKDKLNYKVFLKKYETICTAIDDTNISLTCSNYVNGEVVHLLNADKMELRDGVGYMVRIYNIAPSNFQAKKNLEGILCSLAIKAETEGLSSDKNALSKAMLDTNNAFQAQVEDAKIQAALSVIVDKVNSGKMKQNTALSEVYKLYKKAPDNDRVCENLVTICEMCIFEYVIKDAYGAKGVKATLDSLQSNMSTTFKKKATKLSKPYFDIWNQLPPNTQMLLNGSGMSLGGSLNDKGYALKAGLNYLKTLGSVSST